MNLKELLERLEVEYNEPLTLDLDKEVVIEINSGTDDAEQFTIDDIRWDNRLNKFILEQE